MLKEFTKLWLTSKYLINALHCNEALKHSIIPFAPIFETFARIHLTFSPLVKTYAFYICRGEAFIPNTFVTIVQIHFTFAPIFVKSAKLNRFS